MKQAVSGLRMIGGCLARVSLLALAGSIAMAANDNRGSGSADETTALLSAWDQGYEGLRGVVAAAGSSNNLLRDSRGRTIADDIRDWVLGDDAQSHIEALRREAEIALRAGDGTAGHRDLDQAQQLVDIENRRLTAIRFYWRGNRALDVHRSLWQRWLDEVTPQAATSSRAQIEPLEVALARALEPGMTADTINPPLQALFAAYNAERARLARSISEERAVAGVALPEQARQSPCPAVAARTSGAAAPRMIPESVSVQDFYPLAEQRNQIEGRVVVRVNISAAGCMERSALEISSGSPALDDGALALAERALFLPAERQGKPVAAVYSLAVRFQLQDGKRGLQ